MGRRRRGGSGEGLSREWAKGAGGVAGTTCGFLFRFLCSGLKWTLLQKLYSLFAALCVCVCWLCVCVDVCVFVCITFLKSCCCSGAVCSLVIMRRRMQHQSFHLLLLGCKEACELWWWCRAAERERGGESEAGSARLLTTTFRATQLRTLLSLSPSLLCSLSLCSYTISALN